jgi:hypothetical protein
MRIDPTKLTPGEDLLWRHGITAPEHIKLDAIAEAEGAEVRYRPLGGCEARLVVLGDRGIISVKSDGANPGRQRFSLAHELAHWMRDRRAGGLLCASDDISPSNIEARSIESEANAYASQLVLPDYLVAQRAPSIAITLDGAQILAREFRSSLTSAAIKLVRHATLPACVVCHRQNATAWFYKGRAWPSGVWIAQELHYDSPAFSLLYGDAGGRTPPHKEPATRWVSGTSFVSREVRCQSMKVPDGTVLTVLDFQ